MIKNQRPEFDKLIKTISSKTIESKKNILLIGPEGSGKTKLIKYLTHKFKKFVFKYINIKEIVGIPELFIERYLEIITGQSISYNDLERELIIHESGGLKNIEQYEKNKTKSLFLKGVSFPNSRKKLFRIIALDDFEYINALKYFPGFSNIDAEFLECLSMQKDCLYIVSVNSRSRNDIFFTEKVKEVLTQWDIIDLEPLDFELSQSIAEEIPGLSNSKYIPDICILSQGNPGLINLIAQNFKNETNIDSKQDYQDNFISVLAKSLIKKDGILHLYLKSILKCSISKVRGGTSLISCLKVLAKHESLILKEISKILLRSPQVVKDYLDWLVKSGLIEKKQKQYRICDNLLKYWILLNLTGISENVKDSPSDSQAFLTIKEDFEKMRGISGYRESKMEEEKIIPQVLVRNEEDLLEFD